MFLILTRESEGYLVSKLEKLSPLSFVSFHQGSLAPKKNGEAWEIVYFLGALEIIGNC